MVKGFGRRPIATVEARRRGGVRKPPKEETASRKGRLFERARAIGI